MKETPYPGYLIFWWFLKFQILKKICKTLEGGDHQGKHPLKLIFLKNEQDLDKCGGGAEKEKFRKEGTACQMA